MIPFVFGAFGHQGRSFQDRFFERGRIKLVILDLISEKPRHGYDIIQELENRSHGMYSPSAGTVYPILQLLEDQGFVELSQKEGKKTYSITGDGDKYLKEYKEEVEHLKKADNRFEEKFGPYAQDIFSEVKEITPLIFKNLRNGALKDYEKAKELRTAVRDFRRKIEKIFPEE
jgi:DNA-binding PadR family transcriptional regulator